MSFFKTYGKDLGQYAVDIMERYPKLYDLLDLAVKQYIVKEGTKFNRSTKLHKRLFEKKTEAYKEKFVIRIIFRRLSRILTKFLRFVIMIVKFPTLTVMRYEKLRDYKSLRGCKVLIPEPICPIQRMAWHLPPLKKIPTCNCGGKGCRWCWR